MFGRTLNASQNVVYSAWAAIDDDANANAADDDLTLLNFVILLNIY